MHAQPPQYVSVLACVVTTPTYCVDAGGETGVHEVAELEEEASVLWVGGGGWW